MPDAPATTPSTAQQLVRMLEKRGVTHAFGVPGAKIDSVFEALLDSKIELVLCRHEQNAAFMAAAMGRMTGRCGVAIATSGPGVGNLVTGLATATTEGDPVLAIGGEVPLDERVKSTHQSLDSVSLMRAVTKYSSEISTPMTRPARSRSRGVSSTVACTGPPTSCRRSPRQRRDQAGPWWPRRC